MNIRDSKLNILLVTHNDHKVQEIREMLDNGNHNIISLKDIGFHKEIIEDGSSFEANALIKARTFQDTQWRVIIGEDSGLEIKILDNQPGIHTAHFAGKDRDPIANMEKVLKMMGAEKDRRARFKTVIALIYNKEEYIFEGLVNGEIAHEMKGEQGFGYDPIFIPDGYNETFAELGETVKNSLSHRYNAVLKLKAKLKELES